MTTFTIDDADLAGIKDKVVLLTGASSGIGLATLKLLLHHNAKVFASDLDPLPSSLPSASTIPFLKADVSSWTDQVALFKAAHAHYGRIDHVFANAGIAPSEFFIGDDVDENGDPMEPKLTTINVNLVGVMYSVKLGIFYLKKNLKEGGEGEAGSIVLTASGSSFSAFAAPDYTTSKHAVLGLVRSLTPVFASKEIPIRINCISPSWTRTNILPSSFADNLGDSVQSPDVVARSAVILMVDEKRGGQCIYSDRGSFMEMEQGENGMLTKIMGMVDFAGSANADMAAAT